MAKNRVGFVRLACVAWMLAGATIAGGQGPKPDPRLRPEAFWAAPPQSDPITAALYAMDDSADASAAIDDLEDALGSRKKGPGAPAGGGGAALGVMSPSGGNYGTPKLALTGDAKSVAGGRWGGGVRVGGGGSARITGLDLARMWEGEGAATVDLWVKPDASGASGGRAGGARETVLSLSGIATPGAIRVERAPGGAATLWVRDQLLLTHPRGLPAGVWTHVCLTLGMERGVMTAALYVDGLGAGVGAETMGPLAPGAIAVLGGAIDAGGTGGGTGAAAGGAPAVAAAPAGLRGLIDVLRVTRGKRYLYELADEQWQDREAEREVVDGPPYFVRSREPNVYWSFDGSVTAKLARAGTDAPAGAPAGAAAKPTDFAPGVRGQALSLARARELRPAAAGADALPLDRGSLEFWLRPLDWNNFFIGDYLGTNIPRMTLLRFGTAVAPAHTAASLSIALGRAGAVADAPFVKVHPGVWTHVLCTWGPGGAAVYLNGEPQPMAQVGLAIDAAGRKALAEWKSKAAPGDGGWALTLEPSGTLVDELRVYNRQLNAAEASNAFARHFPDAAARLAKLPLIGVTYKHFAYRPETQVRLACLPVGGIDPVSAKVTIRAPGAGPVATPIFESGSIELTQDGVGGVSAPGSLDFLAYDVTVESRGPDGKTLHTLQTQYVREKPPWWRNELGNQRVVPRPWTPVVVKEGVKAVEVLGRSIVIDATGLPAQIEAAGESVLAASPRVHGTVNGAAVTLAGAGVKAGEAAPDQASWSAELAGGGLKAQVRASIEFDGLMRYAVTLKSQGGPAKIDRLMLDFPMREERGKQLIVNGGHNNFRASYDVRMVPAGSGRVWDSRNSKPNMPKGVAVGHFVPMVWLGDDERGLCFFGENDKGWTPNPAEPAQELLREGGSVIYRMNVITLPVTLEGEREFVFYVLPTPSKPLPEDWRGYNRVPQGRPLGSYDAIDDFCGFPMTEKHSGTPISLTFAIEPHSWEDAARWRQFGKDKFGKQNPIFKYICASWPKFGKSMEDWGSELFWTGRLTWTREVEDYYVWVMAQYLDRGLIEGIYIDDVSFGSTLRPECGAYKLPDGKTQPGFSTLGLRRFFKRLWVHMDQAGKRPHIVPHMTWCFELPAFSFIESGLNGEDRVIPPNAEHTFVDAWSVDEMRVMGGGKKFGFTTLWIPEIKAEGPMAKKLGAWVWRQSRAMHALALQHDYWYLFTYPTGGPIQKPMVDFGIYEPEVRFVPYFDLRGAAEVKASPGTAAGTAGGPGAPAGAGAGATGDAPKGKVLVSFWTRPNQKRALMLVSNLTKADRTVSVELDAAKLLGAAGELVFRDVDAALEPPPSETASKGEVAAAEKNLLKESPSLDGKTTRGGGGGLDDFSLEDEREKKKEAFAIKAQGASATMLVRGNDYRIVEVRLK